MENDPKYHFLSHPSIKIIDTDTDRKALASIS
jgi:hypothetical protein